MMIITIENGTFIGKKSFKDFQDLLTKLKAWDNTEIILNNVRFRDEKSS